MNEKIIYMVRHGLTLSNKEKIYAGWNDEELSDAVADVVNEIVDKAEVLNNNGEVSIDQDLVESILDVADLINENASPVLKKAIKHVKKAIKQGNFFRQLGITINE